MNARHTSLKSTFIAALAVLMVLTSTAMAMGQLRAAAVGEMVLCTGHSLRTVQIDANGQPVEPRVTCPDCLLDVGPAFANPATFSTPANYIFADFKGHAFATIALPMRERAYVTRAPPLL